MDLFLVGEMVKLNKILIHFLMYQYLGEGGLLGHGNEDVQSIPKEIETLKG